MKNTLSLLLCFSLLSTSTAFAGIGSNKAAYQGGTTKNQDFPGAKDAVEGSLLTDDRHDLLFAYKLSGKEYVYKIPYNRIVDIEYGQKAGRRVGAAIATAILISPVGLFLLFSKKRKHFITIGYRGTDGKEEVAVFELGKDVVRTTLAIMGTRSGVQVEYQDDEGCKLASNNRIEDFQLKPIAEPREVSRQTTEAIDPELSTKRCYENGHKVPCAN